MKGKIIRGSGFRGVLSYVLDEDKAARIVGGNMTGQDAKGLAREFGHVRRLRPDCGKPVLHIALRLPAGEDVSDGKWLAISLDVLKLMQLSDRPWVLVKHLGEHVHLVTSRVDNGGRVWAGKWEALRLIDATQQLERKFGLTITPGLGGKHQKQVRLTSGQLRKIQREVDRGQVPEVPAKIAIAERIERAIAESNGSFDDFEARLEKLGVNTALNTAKTTDHVSGVSFAFEGVSMKGSKVARAYSWQGLNRLLAERKDAYENPRTPQQNLTSGPRPDDSRATQSTPASTGQRAGPVGNWLAGGGGPIPPSVPLAARGDDYSGTGVVPDLLLSLLAEQTVTAGIAANPRRTDPAPGAIIGAAGKARTPRRRLGEDFEEDDGPAIESDGPTMSF